MTTYNTDNPVPSTDVRDLYDNAENLDSLVNGSDDSYLDRKGVSRKSWRGMENDFQQFLLNSGYEFIGDYDADGPLTITARNQIFTKDGEFWRASAVLTLPYTTVNNWAVDQPKFVSVGDAVLRQDLAGPGGSALVEYDGGTVEEALDDLRAGQLTTSPEQFGDGTYSGDNLVSALATGKAVQIAASVSSITLTNGSQTLAVLEGLERIQPLGGILTLNIPAGQFSPAARVLSRAGNAGKIRLLGAATVDTTLSSISSVTGTPGAWSVTGVLASAAGMAVGDLLLLRGVTPGVQQPGTYSGQPVRGALQLGFFGVGGTGMGSLSTVGTACTITGTSAVTFIASGDLIVAGGAIRRVLGAPTASNFTVDAAFPRDLPATDYWYVMKPSGQGTVTVSGTTVTGTGTFFTNQRINVGDNIMINGRSARRVVSITDDTHLEIHAGGIDIATASIWGALTPGELHEGAWKITGIVGNSVTWTHTGREAYAPPLRNITGGVVNCIKTNLDFGVNSGFVTDGNTLEIDRIGIIGGNGANNVGIDLRGESPTDINAVRPSGVVIGALTGVNGFDYGARVAGSAYLYAAGAAFSGAFIRGIDSAEFGGANLSDAVVSGAAGIGVFIGTGCSVRLSSARVVGNSLQGVRMEVGANAWMDFGVVGNNIGDNVLCVGGVEIHYVGLRSFNSGGSGISGQNGGYGRGSGCLVISPGAHGQNWTGAHIEAGMAMVLGATLSGLVVQRGRFGGDLIGLGYNVVRNIQAGSLADVSVLNSTCIGSPTGILATGMSRVLASGIGFAGNTTDSSAIERSVVYLKGKIGGASFIPALDTPSADKSENQTV